MTQKRIILSRTDSIGDVILTLPMAGALKEYLPNATIIFLGRNYTRDIVAQSANVDVFLSWDEINKLPEKEQVTLFKEQKADIIVHVFPVKEIAKLAAKAKISVRIGSTGRIYHYLYCNKLVALSRENSELHEAQLNFKLSKSITGKTLVPSFDDINNYYGFDLKSNLQEKYKELIDKNRFNLILHPKSKGSAREWPLKHFTKLIRILPDDKFKIFVTGTDQERKLMSDFLTENKDRLTDLTGEFSLNQFISFIKHADGLVAASTGPLHIAAALGKLAVGIYPPIRPMHPGRWAPIGKNAHSLVTDKSCDDCRKSGNCHCMTEVYPESVKELLLNHA